MILPLFPFLPPSLLLLYFFILVYDTLLVQVNLTSSPKPFSITVDDETWSFVVPRAPGSAKVKVLLPSLNVRDLTTEVRPYLRCGVGWSNLRENSCKHDECMCKRDQISFNCRPFC